MKSLFTIALILFYCGFTIQVHDFNKQESNLNPDKQSIDIGDIKNKNIGDSNFDNKLKQAENELLNSLKVGEMRVDSGKIKKGKVIQHNWIVSLDSEIKLSDMNTYGVVKEKVKFKLVNGSFSSLIRKISLVGSSDSLVAFKLSSNDIKLREVKVIENCYEDKENNSIGSNDKFNTNKNSSITNDAYICVISIFDEVDAPKSGKVVEIEYEYIAQNILRVKNSDSSNTYKNSIIWYFDNNNRPYSIENITTKIILENIKLTNINKKDIVFYPDKFEFEKREANEDSNLIVKWNIPIIHENEYQKISLDLPFFNSYCRKLVRSYFIII